MKKIINKRNKITALLKIFIKKEKNVDLISEMKEIDKETGNPFIRIFTGSDSICLPVKEVNEEVR